MLDTYNEPSEMSNLLFQIPKIFCIDSCRGSASHKIVRVNPENNGSKTKFNKQQPNNDEKETVAAKSSNTGKNEETFSSKAVSKEESNALSSNYSNFCKIWANVDGYAVADGSLNGGLFLRNVSKLFQHQKWILNHNLNDIILKIRDYTKREATLIGFLNFTQLVENEGTMERPVRFDVRDKGMLQLDKSKLDKVVITNLSSTDKIGILVENEQNNEDRTKLLQSLVNVDAEEKQKNNNNSTDLLFTSNGYQIISPSTKLGSQCVKIMKTSDYVFVTVINITEKELICDRKRYLEDYLYFEDDDLQRLSQYKPKCKNKNGKKHKLQEVNSKNNNNKFKCDGCTSNKANIYFHCYKCQYTLCQDCCHLKICSQT